MQPTLKIKIQDVKDDYQVVEFTGEFDKAGYSEIKESLSKLVEDFAAKDLVLDFSDLKFINSEGIGFLMELHTHLVKRNMKLVVVGADEHIMDVFQTIGLQSIVTIMKNLDAYLKQK